MTKTKSKTKKVKQKRKTTEKKTTTKPKILGMDDVYRLISRVQLNKREVHFNLTPEDAVTADNVLRDLELKYDRKETKGKVAFAVHPNEKDAVNEEAMDVDVDFFQDEMPEEGEIF